MLPLRLLPRRVPPVLDETLPSYLRRLAHANYLDDEALRTHVAGSTRARAHIDAGRLAVLAGLPADALRYAILELATPAERATMNLRGRPRPAGTPQLACRRCVARQGIRDPVEVWATHEAVVCPRHHLWLRAPRGHHQPDLTGLPHIVRAHRRHRRLIRRHGRGQVLHAYGSARTIVDQWTSHWDHDADYRRNMNAFHGETWSLPPNDPTADAANYPQTIALTRLLASPYWLSHALQIEIHGIRDPIALDAGPGHAQFIAEVRRTVAPAFVWNPNPYRRRYEPLSSWLIQEITIGQHRIRQRIGFAHELITDNLKEIIVDGPDTPERTKRS